MENNELSKNVGRILAIALALCMVLSGIVIISHRGSVAAAATGETEYVLIDTTRANMAGVLKANGINIVEDYGGFVMAEVNGAQKQQFADANLVTEMPGLYEFNYNKIKFDVRQGPPAGTMKAQAPTDEFQEDYYFVKMFGPVKEEWKDDILATGAEIYSAIPVNGFLVKMDAGQKAAVEANSHVLWVGHFDPAYKVAPEVQATGGNKLPVTVLTFPNMRDSVIAQMAQHYGRTGRGMPVTTYATSGAEFTPYIQDGKMGYIRAYVDADTAAEIAKMDGVLRIEWFDQPKIMNDVGHSYTQSLGTTSVGAPASLVAGAYGASVPIWNAGLFGTGLVAAVSDTGIVGTHNLFRDASVSFPYNSTSATHRKCVRYMCGAWSNWDSPVVDPNQDDPNDHGTHTVGSVLGYDNPVSGTLTSDGMAPGAKISFCDIGNGDPDGYVYPPNDYTTMWAAMAADGARTQSNSWGSAYQATYTADEAMIDQWIYDHPTMLFSFSAGNEGTAEYTVGNQAAAKNAIAVGATGSNTQQTNAGTASFSSSGPSYDDRLKPDVCTSGTQVASADGDTTNAAVAMQGTSMSAPQVEGSVLLMTEYFLDGFYPTGAAVPANSFDPSHSLMKALLVNSCTEGSTYTLPYRNYYNTGTTGSYPSCNQGFGRIQLNNVLKFSADTKKLQVYDGDNGLTTGSYIDYKYRVTATTENLRVTINWCDYPATPGVGTALVNNLDLTITSPTGAVFKGNVFSGNAPGASLPNTGTYDAKNNIEHFTLAAGNANLVTGTWNIRVSGTSVPYAPQPFAIVITGALDLNWGNIQIDQAKYSDMETANVRIEDTGAGAGPLTAHAYCPATGDWETVTCTMSGTGVFLGTMGFTLNAVTQNNSALTVQDGSTVVFFYDDVSGTVHRSWANATIDAAGPVMTNIRAEEISHMSAIIKWTNSENGNGTVYYGPTTSLGFEQEEATPFTTNQMLVLTGLSPNTLYYYDVESWDMYGHKVRATNGGSHYTFKTATKGDVLVIISDDEGFNVTLTEEVYSIAMDNTGWSYNFWKCYQAGLPTLAELQSYKAVIWQVGFEHYPPFDANERLLVKNYNNGGGRLWIQSHDVAWAFGDTALSDFYSTEANLWMQAQCKITWQVDPTTWPTMTGVTGDPISGAYTAGVPYYPLRDGGAGDEINSVAAGGAATYIWRTTDGSADDCAIKWISSANNGTSGVGVWGGTPTRIVTLCGEWYRFGSTAPANNAARTDILDKTLQWLLGHDHPTVTVSAPNGGETINTATTPISWTSTVYGGTSILNTKLYYSPNNGQAWYLITTLTPGASPYTWTVSGLPNGNQYLVKVEVTDNGVPNLIGSDVSNAVFTITSGTDVLGPIVLPGTEQARPIPVVIGNTMWFNGTVDDSTKGNSPIAGAEYFVDGTGATGTGTDMNAADGSFNSVTEAVTWSGTCALTEGTHTLRMRGVDNRGNWGILENITFQVIPGAAPPPDPYEISLTGRAANSWVFVSFPSGLTGNIQDLLTDLGTGGDGLTDWTIAKWYNPQTPADPWKTYRVGGTANDMPTVNNQMGFWLWLTANGGDQLLTLSSYGAIPASTGIQLYAGWNLVGYPSTTDRSGTTTPAAVDIISVYSASAAYTDYVAKGSVTLHHGNAYFMHATANTMWTVTEP